MTDLCSGAIYRASSGDGAGSTLWRTDTDAWLEVDMRCLALRLLESVTIYWWAGCVASSIVFEVSIEGVSWKPIASVMNVVSDPVSEFSLGKQVTFRFFRLSMQAGKRDPFFHRFRLGIKNLTVVGSVIKLVSETEPLPVANEVTASTAKLWRPLPKQLSGLYAARQFMIPRLGRPSYAPEYIQLEPRVEPQLMTSLPPIPPSPLPFTLKKTIGDPNQWRKVLDGNTCFYVNATTGECCADPPDVLFNASADATLPPGWHRQQDHKSARVFYWHRAQPPTWEFPLITFPQS